jgi:hypothetical protein
MRQAVLHVPMIGWLLGLGLLAVMGCEPPADTRSHGGPVADHVSFVDALRGAGYAVEVGGEVHQPFLNVAGTVLRVRGPGLEQGEEVQSYGYETVEAAKADAGLIQPDGTVEGMKISWIGPPHFFLRERVLVIYVGDNPHTIRLLSGLLGSPFAGR